MVCNATENFIFTLILPLQDVPADLYAELAYYFVRGTCATKFKNALKSDILLIYQICFRLFCIVLGNPNQGDHLQPWPSQDNSSREQVAQIPIDQKPVNVYDEIDRPSEYENSNSFEISSVKTPAVYSNFGKYENPNNVEASSERYVNTASTEHLPGRYENLGAKLLNNQKLMFFVCLLFLLCFRSLFSGPQQHGANMTCFLCCLAEDFNVNFYFLVSAQYLVFTNQCKIFV